MLVLYVFIWQPHCSGDLKDGMLLKGLSLPQHPTPRLAPLPTPHACISAAESCNLPTAGSPWHAYIMSEVTFDGGKQGKQAAQIKQCCRASPSPGPAMTDGGSPQGCYLILCYRSVGVWGLSTAMWAKKA